VRLLGTALVIPTTTEVGSGGRDGKKEDENSGLAKEAIEQVAIRAAWKWKRTGMSTISRASRQTTSASTSSL